MTAKVNRHYPILLGALVVMLVGCQGTSPLDGNAALAELGDNYLDGLSDGSVEPYEFTWVDPAATDMPASQDVRVFGDPDETEQAVVVDDGGQIDTGIPIAAACLSGQGTLTYNGNAPNRFSTDPQTRSPTLNAPNQQAMGPSVGNFVMVVNGQQVQKFRIGNTFLVHFPLNGVHGCSSEQYLAEWVYTIDTRNNALTNIGYNRAADGPPPANMAAQNFFGNTMTGVRSLPGGFTYYEGTQNNLTWWDGAGRTGDVTPNSPFVEITVLALASVAKSPGAADRKCHTIHVFALNHAAIGGVAPVAMLNPILAQANLQQLIADIRAMAIAKGAPQAELDNIAQGAAVLQVIAAAVLRQNPHYEGACL